MARYSRNQKDKSIDKLKHINITSEKAILNVKLSELKKINKTMPPYKYIRNVIITEEELIKTTTLKIKRHEEMKKILNAK